MRKSILVIIIALLVMVVFFWWNSQTRSNSAVSRVLSLPEVKEYLQTVPRGVVEIDHEDKETNSEVIHVYEIKDGHTATFNWYQVIKKTGEIKAEFETIEQ